MGILLFILLWWLIGFSGFLYWETSDHDVYSDDIPVGLLVGIAGIFSWVMGWVIYRHKKVKLPKIIFKKRKIKDN